MDTIPRNDFILRNRYDAFCKAVLRNEAKDYLREMGRQREREKSLDALTQQELDKLSTVDHYPSDSSGDAMAMEQVLRYYESYINKLCTRTLYDSNGFPYVCVDEYMKRRLEIKLIHAIIVALK